MDQRTKLEIELIFNVKTIRVDSNHTLGSTFDIMRRYARV